MKRGKKSQIPKESKRLKYLYFIVLMFRNEKVLKFGISNNYMRRFREYNNSTTVGYYVETLDVFKSTYPKRLEYMLKWGMNGVAKPIFKQEYFDLCYYGMLKQKAYEYAEMMNIDLQKII